MTAFDNAWQLLKEEPVYGYSAGIPGDGDYHGEFDVDEDGDHTIFYEDFGPVKVHDYYNADWHINHPSPHIHEDLPPRDELQAQLDEERRRGHFPFGKPDSDNSNVDPFRMKRPDIESEIEEMATEMGRRRGRKAVDYDHQLDFDTDNPQNQRLINVTAPHMREREAALNAEMDRRAEKGGKT